MNTCFKISLTVSSRLLLNSARNMSSVPCKRLEGRIAIVTASTDGIGFSIAKRLAEEGAKVLISSRKQENVDKAVKTLSASGLNVHGVVCHVSKADHRKKLFDEAAKLGGLDILVSNAAVNPEVGAVLDASEESWDKIFDVNVKAAFMLSKESLPLLKKSKAGRIVFISSIAGFQPFDLLGAYSVSKTALLGLTKAAALQLAADNITVNCIAPGIIKTKFSNALTTGPAEEVALSQIPLKRFGIPDNISGIVAMLASDDGAYITGESVIAAGGMPSRL